jgi:hypothetical protein
MNAHTAHAMGGNKNADAHQNLRCASEIKVVGLELTIARAHNVKINSDTCIHIVVIVIIIKQTIAGQFAKEADDVA